MRSRYAHACYPGASRKKTLTEMVLARRECRKTPIPLPHPSGRNNHWLKHNPWFAREVLPHLRRRVRDSLRLG